MIEIGKLKDDFIEQRRIVANAREVGDYEANNNAMRKLQTIFKKFEKNIEVAESVLSELLAFPEASVQVGAATFCISLNIKLKEAELVLLNISKCSHKIMAYNAQNILDVWKKQGFLLIYPTQKPIYIKTKNGSMS